MQKSDDLLDMRAVALGEPSAQTAMARVFERHFNRVTRHVRMAYPRLSEAEAADFISLGFIQAFEKASSFRGESGLQTWLVRIITNLILSSARRDQIVGMVSIEASDEAQAAWDAAPSGLGDPVSQVLREQSDDCVRRQFEAFRHRHPQPAWALWARLCDETPLDDLARLLEKSNGATRQYLSDWGGKLRKFLAPCLPLLQEA